MQHTRARSVGCSFIHFRVMICLQASLALDMDRFSSSSQQVEFLTRKLDAVTEENTLVEAVSPPTFHRHSFL